MSDVARWALRGPVQTLRIQFARWNPEAGDWWPLKNRCVATFRADGQLSEVEHHNPDGSVPREVRVYDDAGRLIEEQGWSDDVLTRRVLHTYGVGDRSALDENGRKTTVVFLPGPETNSAICSASSYEATYGVEGTDVAYSAPGATSITTIHDEHDRPSEAIFHDAHHAVVRRVVFSRDDDGRLLSERMEFAGPRGLFGPVIDANIPSDERASMMDLLESMFEDSPFSHATYAYDGKGRRIETVRRMGTLSEEREIVRYDDFDNPVEEVRLQASREMNIDDGVVKTEERPSHALNRRPVRAAKGPAGGDRGRCRPPRDISQTLLKFTPEGDCPRHLHLISKGILLVDCHADRAPTACGMLRSAA